VTIKRFATTKTSRRAKNLVNTLKDELLNFTTNDHAYFWDLTDVGAEEEVDKDDSGMSWNIGIRFVELDILAKNMFSCRCNVPLHLQDSVSERVGGFWSHLYIRCCNLDCPTITYMPSDKLGPSGNYFLSFVSHKQGTIKGECAITFLDTLILSGWHEKHYFKYLTEKNNKSL